MAYYTESSYVIAAGAVFLALCPLFLGLRLLTRLQITDKKSFGIDDGFSVLATLLTIACAIDIIAGVRLNFLAHPAPLHKTNDDSWISGRIQFVFLTMHPLAMGAIKLTFITFFRRVFCISWKSFRTPFDIASAVLGILALCWSIALTFWYAFSCRGSLHARWDLLPGKSVGGSCNVSNAFSPTMASSDFVIDVLVFVLPIFMVLKLQMRTARKLLVLAVFSLGMVALVMSIVRLAIYVTYQTGLEASKSGSVADDYNLYVTRYLYWSMLETGLAQIASCLPVLGPLLHQKSLSQLGQSIRSLSDHASCAHKEDLSSLRSDSNREMVEPARVHGIRGQISTNELKSKDSHGSQVGSQRLRIQVEHGITQTSETV